MEGFDFFNIANWMGGWYNGANPIKGVRMFRKRNHDNEISKPPEVLVKLRDLLPSLSGEEKRLAEYILLHYASVPKLSLVQLAEEAMVSPGTVCDFCETMGFKGYHALHEALAEIDSVAASVFFEGIDASFDLRRTVKSVFDHITNVLTQTFESLDMDSMQQAVDAISVADQIVILGLGTSASVAQEFAFRLEWIGLNCNQYVDPHRQLMAITLLDQDDVAIAISHSGRTKNIVNALKLARERGTKTICITDFPHSPITEYADIRLYPVHAESNLGVEMVATRAAHLALIDAIATSVALGNRKRAITSITLNERLLINLRY
jgi:RpiR family carbohydrate utilization transcriptional regulator